MGEDVAAQIAGIGKVLLAKRQHGRDVKRKLGSP
jgi:hypothetical protein